MRPHATREEIDHVCERIREFGYKVHSIEGEAARRDRRGRGRATSPLASNRSKPRPAWRRAVRISAPYKFVSRNSAEEPLSVKINGVRNRRRRIRHDGRPLLGGERKADHGDGRGRGRGRRPRAARRSVQAAHLALRFPGHGTGRASSCCARPRRPPASASSPKS